ncbi:MAG TPA: hypothetical protein DCE18_15630 [Syntrophobacteraceae bacterium]|nr:hypothetical protein [Syntrophobacteraceae bacterium]
MGRPSKLSDREWAEVGRRLARGESTRKLAAEYKVAKSTIQDRFSGHVPEIREAAQALASAERTVERMPVSVQVSVRSLADQLKGIQDDYAETAAMGMQAARIVQTKVLAQARNLPDDPSSEDLKPIIAGSETTKSLSSLATNMITANKGNPVDEDKPGLAERVRRGRMRVAGE